MNNSGDQNRLASRDAAELMDLIWDFSEGTIGEADMARLNELLLADPSNRLVYARFMNVIACLEHELALPEVEFANSVAKWTSELTARVKQNATLPNKKSRLPSDSAGSAPPATMQMLQWRRIAAWFYKPFPVAICALLATVIALLSIWQIQRSWQIATPEIATSQPGPTPNPPCAYLASAVGNIWGADSPQLQTLGSPVQIGEYLVLQEGVAEFRLSSGVLLSIEGPASLVMISPKSLVLQYGRLTANVPDSIADFKVMAGTTRLTARKSEFGVYLAGGYVDLHVFSGQVLAVNTSFIESRPQVGIDRQQDGDVAQPSGMGILDEMVVVEGRSLVLSDDEDVVKVVRWGRADGAKFATRLPMAEPLPISQAYVDSVLESRPVGYWRFESMKGRIVRNEIAQGGDLQVVGNVALVGDAANRAVELGLPGPANSTGFLAGLSTTNQVSRSDYTVEVWVRPSHVHAAAIVTLAGISAETHDERPAFYLSLFRPGMKTAESPTYSGLRPGWLRFLNRDPPGGWGTGTPCYSKKCRSRRWQYIVATKEGPNMRFYIDGVLASEANDSSTLAPELRLIVGESATTRKTYPFHGQVDELALYKRALTENEIQQHYKAVDWSLNRQKKTVSKSI
jgi:hypothetical protein